MGVAGSTVEQRQEKRRERTHRRRVRFFKQHMRKAQTGRAKVQQACDYAKAVADELGDDQRKRLALAIAAAVEAAEKEAGLP